MKGILVKQRDKSDCGAACIASIAAYYKMYVPVMKIRQLAGTNKLGSSIKGMIEAAEKLSLQSVAVRASYYDIPSIKLPAIFHLVQASGAQHFIVVYNIGKKAIRYMDPATGTMIGLKSANLPGWTGIILMLFPAGNFEKGNLKRSIFPALIKLVRPYRFRIIRTAIASMVYAMLGLAIALYVQKFVDDILPNKNIEKLNFISLLILIVFCLRTIIGFIQSRINYKTTELIDFHLILGYFKHVMKLPQMFFDNMRPIEIISRINDAHKIRIFINDVAFQVLTQMLIVLFGIICMIIYQWRLALVIIIAIPVYAFLYKIKSRACSKWLGKTMNLSALLDNQLKETFMGITTIKHFRAENDFIQNSKRILSPLMTSIYRSDCSRRKFLFLLELITCFWTVSILCLGFRFVFSNQLSLGGLLSFYCLIGFLITPVLSIFRAKKTVREALIASERIFEIFDLETEEDASSNLRHLNTLPEGDLVFTNVFFSYNRKINVFAGLDLRVIRKKITAITGETDCGKSTILSLILRLYLPESGAIKIGDQDFNNLSLDLVRRKITAVSEKDNLFRGSIISNITMGSKNFDMARIFEISNRLGLHEFIENLPKKYESNLLEEGLNLSKGQKQRISIARAIYRDPEILILDEITSELDEISYLKIMGTIHWFMRQDKTVLIITRKWSTVKNCDSVIYLRKSAGAISGTHKYLMATNEQYANMWQSKCRGN